MGPMTALRAPFASAGPAPGGRLRWSAWSRAVASLAVPALVPALGTFILLGHRRHGPGSPRRPSHRSSWCCFPLTVALLVVLAAPIGPRLGRAPPARDPAARRCGWTPRRPGPRADRPALAADGPGGARSGYGCSSCHWPCPQGYGLFC